MCFLMFSLSNNKVHLGASIIFDAGSVDYVDNLLDLPPLEAVELLSGVTVR